MRDHQNVFFYYAGSAKAVDGRTRQIEDNTTKALINLLELSAIADPEHRLLRRFLEWVGIPCKAPIAPRFALQLASIGPNIIERASRRILLGIAPKTLGEDLPEVEDDAGSRPDAWIWTRDFVLCIETKVIGTFRKEQLAAHQKTLGAGSKAIERDWRAVYSFFADQRRRFQSEHGNASTLLLLEQFVEYLRIIAYRQEIDMGEFDGFHPQHFAAFTFLDDEDAEDNRKQVKHYLGQFLDAVFDELPKSLREFDKRHLGNLGSEDRSAWATLSRIEKMVNEPHYSFLINGSSVCVRLLIEGNQPARRAKKRIESNRKEFLRLLSKLPEFEIRLIRRWHVQVQNFDATLACSIMLDCVAAVDVDYMIEKMIELERPGAKKGYFMIMIDRRFSFDLPAVRTRRFAKTAAQTMMKLVPIREFLEG